MSARTIWQLAAGASGRFVSDIFFEHDVACLGPGHLGEYTGKDYASGNVRFKSSVECIHRLAKEMQPGDIIVVRSGLVAVGLGVVADEPYCFANAFDDLYGWDLQHTRRVIWQDQLVNDLQIGQAKDGPLFGHMKQIPSLTRLQNETVLPKIRPLFEKIQSRPLRVMPPDPEPLLTLDEVGDRLFARGLSHDMSDKVVDSLRRQQRLNKWYGSQDAGPGGPTEHEVVAHMILPMLLALGWSEQLLAIEWNKIDLAGFGQTPTQPHTCTLVCEAKAGDHGLQAVERQAMGYIKRHGLMNWRKVLVTQGGRYYVFSNDSGDFHTIGTLSGYLNVNRIRETNFFPKGTNQIDTLIGLTPAGVAGDT